MPVWTALDLTNVRTDVLRSLDLTRGPAAAAHAVRTELAARRAESRVSA
jgi:hypothetical protein